MSSSSGPEIRPTMEDPRMTPVTSLEELFRCWRLDAALRRYYDLGLGIEHLYPWQSKCLAEHGVAEGTRNLLYFAPTSGGKTMVAELLLLLRVMGLPSSQEFVCDRPQGRLGVDQQKGAAMKQAARRAVFVLPFVSMVTEKVKHLQKVVAPYNRGKPKRKRIKVKALYGSKGGGGNGGTQIAVCTIEKANALINRMAAANELQELCCLVVDELHMIGEDGRGQTLELLLSKVVRANRIAHHHKDSIEGPEGVARDSARSAAAALTVSRDGRPGSSQSMLSRKEDEVGQCGEGPGARTRQTQIIGMSATLSNGAELAAWLEAILHVSDYRPVPLDERVLLGMHVYDKSGNVIRSFSEPARLETDPDHVVTLCRESCLARDQVIIFCSTKQFCHNCAIKVAKNLRVPASRAVAAERSALMAQLAKEMSMGVDPILQETIPQGVAFHHAGLADTERSAIEAGFRAGTLRALAATSTLGAGVNLPAGRVILRNLNAPGGGLSATSYRQMAGRAGRKGSGKTRGEAIIVASNKAQAKRATALMNAGLSAVKSALKPSSDGGTGLTKMVLEGVCCGLVKTKAELSDYLGCSLLFHQHQQQQCDGINADDGCENLLDHAFAALQLLVDEACIELVPQKRPTTAVTATAAAVLRPLIAARKTQLGAKQPLISPYSNFPSGLRRGQPSEGVATVSVARVSTVQPVGSCAEGVGVDNNGRLMPTKLGMAIFRSSLGPAEGLMVYRDLSEAKHGINLRNTLRLAYLLTPICPPSGLKPNWERLHAMYSRAKNAAVAETLPPGGRSAALSLVDDFHKIGINEGHLHLWASRGPSGCTKQGPLLSPDYVKGVASARRGVLVEGMIKGVSRGGGNRTGASAAQKAVRLVAAMALKDVSDGYNLRQVAKSYGMNKGDLQSLRQATATFSAMVASFLKELGWTMFLMIVKGYVPRLSLGVTNDLLPLMQVPGISRKEASALYQGGILNAKSLVAASQDRVATALRMNVPFRTRRGGGEGGKGSGVGESIHFERRAQMLKNAAKEMDAKREKGNKAQTMKLLRAVQGRLLKSEGDAKDLGGALVDLGGANDLVCFAAAPKGCKRKRSPKGGGSCSLGNTTGLSDGDSGDGSDSSSSSESDASEDLEGDDMDRAVEAMLAEERVAQEEGDSDSEEDGVAFVDVGAAGGEAEEVEAETEREVVQGVIGSEMLRRETAGDEAATEENDCNSFAVEKIKRSMGNEVSSVEGAREFHGGSNKRRKTSGVDEKPSGGTRNFAAPDPKLRYFSAGACKASKAPAAVDAVGAAEGGGFMSSIGGVTGAGWRKRQAYELAPTTPTSKPMPAASSRGCGRGGGEMQQGTRDDARTSRGELRPSPSFLYEGDVSTIGLVPAPSPKAMVLSPQSEPSSPAAAAVVVVRNGARVRDVFGDSGGAVTMAEFSSTWRRSRCFSFTLGGRSVDWAVDTGRQGSGMRLGCSYKRSWESLSSRVPLVPYTVPSAGESFIPMNRHENENAMWILSGIAVSFDGVSSHYLPLPPHLPGRPAEWRRPRHRHEEIADYSVKSSGFVNSWEAMPGKAVESVTHFVGFPWLCPDCSGRDRRDGCVCHSARKHGKNRRRFKPWNQALLVSRRWNAIGVDLINRLATEEPSGRWKLVRDVMEDAMSTKICLDMKGALVCLRSLGIDVRGPLEDPEVAKWLVEPAVDEVTPLQPHDTSKKKRKTPLPPPPRAPRESLSLDRQPKGFVELWGMQAAATLALMGRRERDLKNLGLTLAFHLIEMPAIRAAAMMEYCGIALNSVAVSGIRRDLELKLRDLESVADQLAGDRETAGDKTALASPKRIHDILYAVMCIKPPPSWRSSGVGEGSLAAPPPRVGGASKRVSLGPTDTASLQELLEGSGKEVLGEDAQGFIQAVIQYRALTPASRSLGGLLLARRWHPHLGGVRVNPRVDLFTTTGRMIASEPPLQNLEHKIRLKRSWRLSLAEEMEADLPHVQGLPRVWAEDRGSGIGGESPRQHQGASEVEGGVPGSTQGSSNRESRRVIVANTGESAGISFGEIVGIVEDRFLNDPIYQFPSVSGMDRRVPGDDVGGTESMAVFWEKRGHPYTSCEAGKTRQVLVRLSGGHARVYSYPADKVFRLRASFLSDSRAESLMAASRLGAESCPESSPRNPWFGEEALLRPRAGLVPSAGYVFVSADYSQYNKAVYALTPTQIEMRLMAHLSGDPHLLGVFSGGGDVFRGIAAALEGGAKQASHVTDDERRQTKVVVYGVLYGQSAEALAPQLGVSRPRAWKIRQTVLKTYPKLRDYLQRVKDDCKKNGFVETLLGRRRYLPHINSSDVKERARAERQAANTVCQGSAADLLKLAVTNVAARLEKCEWMSRSVDSPRNAPEWQYETPCRFPEASQRSRAELVKNPPCRLVLSIHDELLYEVLEPHANEVAKVVKACMEGACSLLVPLVAHPRIGKTWASMTDIEADG